MRGPGSRDVQVIDVFVPDKHLLPAIGSTRSEQPLMRFPTGARLAYNKVAISLGLARAGLDAFVELAAGKIPRFSSKSLRDRPSAHRAIALAEVRVLFLRVTRGTCSETLAASVKQRAYYYQGACDIPDSLSRCSARLCGSRRPSKGC